MRGKGFQPGGFFYWSALIAIFAISACSSTDDVQGRIDAVENNLIAAVVDRGSGPVPMPLSDRMQHFMVPGVSIAVINNGRIEWAKGYGVTEAGGSRAVTSDTVFQACSISKPVAVSGIMLLDQAGLLDITRNVNDYLTSWQLPDNAFTAVEKATVERLMSHTGGTSVSGFAGYASGAALPTLLQTLQGLPPANNIAVEPIYTPGTKYEYSGGGMEALHLMTEDLTGRSFRSYIKDNLLTPLGMDSSDYAQPLSGTLLLRAAKGHDADGAALPGGWNTYPELIAAGLWTTPSDLCRLLIEIQKAAAGNGTVFTKMTVDKILTRQPNSVFGLGFMVSTGNGGILFKHTGSNLGYKTYFMGYRDRGQGVAVMTNGENGSLLMYEIVRSVGRVYGRPDWEAPEEADLVDVPLPVLRSYVGNYKQVGGDNLNFQIYLSGTGLMIKYSGAYAGRLDMYPIAQDQFLVRSDLYGTLAFTKDGSGNVTGFTVAEMGITASRL